MELNWKQYTHQDIAITPQIALYWLENHNTNNRRKRQTVIDQYSRDMQSSNFEKTGDTIKFDTEGNLIDGQHRLEGIWASQTTQTLLVVTGLKPSVRPFIDIQAKRTNENAFDSAGLGHLIRSGYILGGTGTGMWERMKWGLNATKGKDTRHEKIDFALKYQDGGVFALTEFGKYQRKNAIHTAPVLAAVARAFLAHRDESSREQLKTFVEVMATGKQKTRRDDVIIQLRESLMKTHSGTNSNAQWEVYGKTARGIQAYLRGETLQSIRTPADDPFPMPSEGSPTSKRKTAATTPRLGRVAGGRGKPNGRITGTDQVVASASA